MSQFNQANFSSNLPSFGTVNKKTTQARAFTRESLETKLKKVKTDGNEISYLKVERTPIANAQAGQATSKVQIASSTLTLTNALGQVKKLTKAGEYQVGQTNRYVYYPDLRLAGYISDILELLTNLRYSPIPAIEKKRTVDMLNSKLQPGRQPIYTYANASTGSVNLDANGIFYNSYDPYAIYSQSGIQFNSEGGTDAAIIDVAFGESTGRGRATEEFPLDAHLQWMEAAKRYYQQTNAPKQEQVNKALKNQVEKFNDFMAKVLATYASPSYVQGKTKVTGVNVSEYNRYKHTGAQTKNIPTAERSLRGLIIPVLNIGGVERQIPIMFGQGGLQNFQDYLQTVVSANTMMGTDKVASNYANYAQALLQSVQQQMNQRTRAASPQMAQPASSANINLSAGLNFGGAEGFLNQQAPSFGESRSRSSSRSRSPSPSRSPQSGRGAPVFGGAQSFASPQTGFNPFGGVALASSLPGSRSHSNSRSRSNSGGAGTSPVFAAATPFGEGGLPFTGASSSGLFNQ